MMGCWNILHEQTSVTVDKMFPSFRASGTFFLGWFCHPLKVLVQLPQPLVVCMELILCTAVIFSSACHIIQLDIECTVWFFLHLTEPMLDTWMCYLMFHLNQQRTLCVLYVLLAVTIWMGLIMLFTVLNVLKKAMVDSFIFQNKLSSITVCWSCPWHSNASFLRVLVWFLSFVPLLVSHDQLFSHSNRIITYCLHFITSFHHTERTCVASDSEPIIDPRAELSSLQHSVPPLEGDTTLSANDVETQHD